MANLPPIPREPIGETWSWRDWFVKIQQAIPATGSILWSAINFTGSDLRNIATRQHNALQDIQGGNGSTEFYHLTEAEHTSVQMLPILGTIATQDSDNVAITGGTIDDVTITNGSVTSVVSLLNSTSNTATAGVQTLPSNPVGFVVVNINGTDYKLPYYNL